MTRPPFPPSPVSVAIAVLRNPQREALFLRMLLTMQLPPESPLRAMIYALPLQPTNHAKG